LKRLSVEGELKNRTAFFSNDVNVSISDSTVYEKNRLLRSGNTLCFPVLWRNDNSLAAYSVEDTEIIYVLPENWSAVKMANVLLITKNGLISKEKIMVVKNQVKLALEAGQPLLIQPVINK
jgi:hypothetical protein